MDTKQFPPRMPEEGISQERPAHEEQPKSFLNKAEDGIISLSNSLAHFSSVLKNFWYAQPRIVRRIISIVVSVLLLHLIMQPESTPIDFVKQMIPFIKEGVMIFCKYVVDLFKGLFPFTLGFKEFLDIVRTVIADILNLAADFYGWLFTYFAG